MGKPCLVSSDLPNRVQVACFADHHIRVVKRISPIAGNDGSGRVTTTFQPLIETKDRVEEVAAMLGK